jgi:hypothetical protein
MPPYEPKYFKKIKFEKKCAKILRKVKCVKVQGIIYMSYAIKS